MKSEGPPPTHGRRFWLGQLPYLTLALLGGVLFASLGGFPPAWPMLVFVEVLVVAVSSSGSDARGDGTRTCAIGFVVMTRPGSSENFRSRDANNCAARHEPHKVGGVTNGDERDPRYPRVMRRWKNAPQPVTTEDEWISQAEAAERLNVSVFRVGWAIACENLAPADTPAGEAGVTLASVDRELRWRANATWAAKVRRGIRSSVRWL